MKALLEDADVMAHPLVICELACGTLPNRQVMLSLLNDLPQSEWAQPEEVFSLIEKERLYRKGLGWIDINLLVSALLSHVTLWTLDKRLAKAAGQLNISQIG